MKNIVKRGVRIPFTWERFVENTTPGPPAKYRKVPLTEEQKAEKKAVRKALKLLERSEFAVYDRDGGYWFLDTQYNLERIEDE